MIQSGFVESQETMTIDAMWPTDIKDKFLTALVGNRKHLSFMTIQSVDDAIRSPHGSPRLCPGSRACRLFVTIVPEFVVVRPNQLQVDGRNGEDRLLNPGREGWGSLTTACLERLDH